MDSLSAEEARRMVDGLPRWLCGECRDWPDRVHDAAGGYQAA